MVDADLSWIELPYNKRLALAEVFLFFLTTSTDVDLIRGTSLFVFICGWSIAIRTSLTWSYPVECPILPLIGLILLLNSIAESAYGRDIPLP